MSLIKQKHVKLYKKYTEALIRDLSKSIILVNEEDGGFCNNCFYDHKNKSSSGQYNGTGPSSFTGAICPVCNGRGKIIIETQKTIQAVAKWIEPDSKSRQKEFVPAGLINIGFFRIKTLVANYNDIKSAKKIIIDGNQTSLMSIIRRGLKDDVVAIGYTTINED
ncbi:MAG: hypothetical protein M0P71_01415 [Melioribacteraceae bacterium]|jgi:hypothetical protein|nr:hypothetical protein [Melioribacteraceae bacterium]